MFRTATPLTGDPSSLPIPAAIGSSAQGPVCAAARNRRQRPPASGLRSTAYRADALSGAAGAVLSRSAGKLLGSSLMSPFTFPRRQQFRRMRRAAGCAVAAIALAAGTIVAAVAGQLVLALLAGLGGVRLRGAVLVVGSAWSRLRIPQATDAAKARSLRPGPVTRAGC
jgi:hypothetical protein